ASALWLPAGVPCGASREDSSPCPADCPEWRHECGTWRRRRNARSCWDRTCAWHPSARRYRHAEDRRTERAGAGVRGCGARCTSPAAAAPAVAVRNSRQQVHCCAHKPERRSCFLLIESFPTTAPELPGGPRPERAPPPWAGTAPADAAGGSAPAYCRRAP